MRAYERLLEYVTYATQSAPDRECHPSTPEQFDLARRLVDDLKADSLDIYTIICTVDSEMGISIPDEEVVNIKTIGDIVKYLEENK